VCGDWDILQQKVYERRVTDLYDIKHRRITEWTKLDRAIIAAAVHQRRRHLSACVNAGGGHFKHCFYRAMRCKRGLCCHAVSVCLSVCPSVRQSRSWITSKRIKISSKFFHRRVATPFWVFRPKWGADILTGTPLTGRRMQGGMIK